jgi:tetratricopeptide (TPR) repeat protein
MKKKTFLLISIIFLLTLTSCATSQKKDELSLNLILNEGVSSFNKKDYITAEKLFSDALLIDKNNEIALKNEILTLNKLDRNADALTLTQKALDFYPDSIKFKLIKARLLRTLNNDMDAIILYKEILFFVGLDKSYHKEYIDYLTSLLPAKNALITSSILEESYYLLKSYMCTEEALIALCTMDKSSLLYSLMLKDENIEAWNKIYELENKEQIVIDKDTLKTLNF